MKAIPPCPGMQPGPYKALVKALVLMDLRCQHYGQSTGARPGELIPPLYWVLGQYLFISAIVAGVLFMRVSVEAYAFVNLAVAMILALTAIIVEFNEVVLDSGEVDLVAHAPVSLRTYAAARLSNLAFYMVLIIASLTILPAIMGCGLRDSGPAFFPAYALASIIGCSGIMWLAIVLYGLGQSLRGARNMRDLFAWTQIIVALLAFYGAQSMLRDSTHSIEMMLATPPQWLGWLPPAWLARPVAQVAGGPGTAGVLPLLVGCVVVALIGVLALARMTAYYREPGAVGTDARANPGSRLARSLVGPVSRALAGRGEPAGLIALYFAMLRRDQELRLRSLLSLAAVLVFLGIGCFLGELGDPFAPGASKAGFPIAVTGLAIFAVPSLIHAMNYSRDPGAAWLFWAAPQPRTTYAEGIRAVTCYGILAPVLAGVTCIFALLWSDPWHALVHGLIGYLGVAIVSHLTVWGMNYPLPFTQPLARGSAMGPVAPYLAGAGTLATLLGVGEYYAARDPFHTFVYVVLLGILTIASSQLSGRAAMVRERADA